MDDQNHIVSGIYTSRTEAGAVRERLIEGGLPASQINIVENTGVADGNAKMADDNETLKNVLVDGSIGTAVGTVIGALGEVALVAGSVTLFVANPLVAPLFMLGWGAFIGGLAGAAIGVDKPKAKKEGPLSELVLDVIRAGHVVLIAHTRSAQETQMVRNVIGDSVVFSPHI